MIVQPRPLVSMHSPLAGSLVPCGLDRHFGPFEPMDGLGAFLGTEWFTCRGCRALVTRANAVRPAAA
jgi:hypothetical protein